MKYVFSAIVGVTLALSTAGCKTEEVKTEAASQAAVAPSASAVKVEMYVMSQCPYGVRAIDAIAPAIKKMGAEVELKIDYIGNEAADGTLTAMHGPNEVKGNIAQLCAMELAPHDAMAFLGCQNADFRNVQTNWESCAKKAGIPAEAMAGCVNGDQGKKLLSDSYKRSKMARASGSPTIKIGGRDYRGSRDEKGFLKAMCRAHKSAASVEVCKNMPPPTPVPVTLVSDARCKSCDLSRIKSQLANTLENPDFTELDISDAVGKQLFDEAGAQLLPLVLIGEKELFAEDPMAARALRRGMKKTKSPKYSVLSFPASWDPVCSIENACATDACAQKLSCRSEKVTLLTDLRCPSCNVDVLKKQLDEVIGTPSFDVLDISDAAGQALFTQVGGGKLPMMVLDAKVQSDSDVLEARNFKIQKTPMTDKVLLVGGERPSNWDVCAQEGGCTLKPCKSQLNCREEQKNTLEVFVVSMCPYGVRALDAMEEVLKNFGSNIDFKVHFIGGRNPDGTASIMPMHGQAELDENIRELCAIHHYGQDNKYMDYVLCRNKNIRSGDWKSCTGKNGIDTATLEKCFSGDEGKKLMQADVQIAHDLQIGASPTWIVNGRNKFSGIDAETVRKNFCAHNPGTTGCENTLSGAGKPVQGGCGQ